MNKLNFKKKKDINYTTIWILAMLASLYTSIILLTEVHTKELEEVYTTIELKNERIVSLENRVHDFESKVDILEDEKNELLIKLEELEQKVATLQSDVKKLKATPVQTRSIGKTMVFEATAYSGDPITATGTVPKVGRTIAVDPKVIPYGSKVRIEGFPGVFIAEDCGGAIKGNIIDIFMGSKEECRAWGRRKVNIEIL